jgi:hypothetical protein
MCKCFIGRSDVLVRKIWKYLQKCVYQDYEFEKEIKAEKYQTSAESKGKLMNLVSDSILMSACLTLNKLSI